MADLLEDAMTKLEALRVAHMSRAVVYSRAGQAVTVNGTSGRRTHEFTDLAGMLQTFESVDWRIKSTEIRIGGAIVEPVAMDRIRDTRGGVVRVYEVVTIGSAGVYDFSDADTLRIHTKRVDTEAAS